VQQLSHKLKGQLSIFSACAAGAARNLEAAGQEGEPDRINELFHELEQQFESLANALRAWLEHDAGRSMSPKG